MRIQGREPKARFSDRVDDYVRYRPGYPVDVVRTLERELGIVPRPRRTFRSAGNLGHDELVSALRRLFDEHAEQGRIRFEYDTKLDFGPLG